MSLKVAQYLAPQHVAVGFIRAPLFKLLASVGVGTRHGADEQVFPVSIGMAIDSHLTHLRWKLKGRSSRVERRPRHPGMWGATVSRGR